MDTPFKEVMVIDFETCWSKSDYTLSKMTTEEYIRDPRFKAWGMSYKYLNSDHDAVWIPAFQLEKFIKGVDWGSTAVLAHNAQFDVSILSWVYGATPCFIFDSLSMARAMRGVEVGNSLSKLAEMFGLPPKGRAVHSTDGIFDSLPFAVEQELADYCCHDVYLCEQIFNALLAGFSGIGNPAETYTNPFPVKELRLIDMTLRMFIQPKLVLDSDTLEKAIEDERTRRTALLERLNVTDSELASSHQFGELLRKLGVEPPMKTSKTPPHNQIPAFAKTDAHFQALLNGDNEDVALLCQARLTVKSTMERTRAQRFLDISRRGPLPVPLRYYAALNGRWGGDQQINMQNLKRGSFLRHAIMAPPGYVLIVPDLSQIEPRVLAWLSDYDALLKIFASGQDAYAAFGAQMFGIPGMTKESHPILRQSAKSALLGAGYQLGWRSFAAQLLTGFLGAPPLRYDKRFAKQLGVTQDDFTAFLQHDDNYRSALATPRTCSDEDIIIHCVAAKKIIDKYREAAEPVVDFWKLCDDMITNALAGVEKRHYKCLTFENSRIMLPNGMSLKYPGLVGKPGRFGRIEWSYGDDKHLFGGKLTENIVSAVARIVMTDAMLRISKRYQVVMTVHDEAPTLVPESEAEEARKWIHEQMVVEPKFMPGIPLAADVGVGKRYGEAK